MMLRRILILAFCFSLKNVFAQLAVARDTITVIENGYVLKMPWANGINFSNVSNIDLNGDNKKDLVVFDRLNLYGVGRFRCFINIGSAGQTKYKEDWRQSYMFPQVTNWAVFKDYNCDGKEDLFCSVNSGIAVYKNESNGSNLVFTLVSSLLLSDYNPGGNPAVTNLYASTQGVPGIVDIDHDGDIDILTFSPQGIFIQYHKNMSKESGYNCDSLIYDYTDNCWGRINESNCQVTMNVCESNKPSDDSDAPKTYHAGSCLTCIDSDGDLDWDLLMGDIACNDIQYVHNTGSTLTASFTDTTKLYPNYPNKGNTTHVKMNNFPCAYNVDVDGDNKNDLIVTPNAYGSENYRSMWFYKNTSATSTVNFQFEKYNFLQDEMIEVGQNAFPVLFDYDADGLKDLLIGNYGYYVTSTNRSRLTLYKNIGTSSQPSYSLITRDYASLSTRTLVSTLPINNAVPTVGDIDQDGDMDILIGTSSGQIHWLENTAGAATLCNFSIFHENPFTITTPFAAAAPQLFDLDGDAKLDLLIGMQNGKIAWYRNNSTSAIPSYTLMTSALGGVDVKGDPNLFGYDGYAVPFFYRENATTNLLVGSFSGAIFQYSVPAVVTSSYTKLSSSVNGLNEGIQATVWYEDINDDSKRDLIVGNAGGGLNFFSSNSTFVGLKEYNTDHNAHITLFPNPSTDKLTIEIKSVDFQKGNVAICDLLGKKVLQADLTSNTNEVNVSSLNKGYYFVSMTIKTNRENFTVTKKIIKE